MFPQGMCVKLLPAPPAPAHSNRREARFDGLAGNLHQRYNCRFIYMTMILGLYILLKKCVIFDKTA